MVFLGEKGVGKTNHKSFTSHFEYDKRVLVQIFSPEISLQCISRLSLSRCSRDRSSPATER